MIQIIRTTDITDMKYRSTHIVAGGTKGIGRALVDNLVGKKHQVLAIGRSKPDRDDYAVQWISADLSKPFVFQNFLPETINCLTFCPGKITLGNARRVTQENLLEAFQTNVLDAFRLTQALLPRLTKAGSSSIVYLSSVAAQIGLPNHSAIATAKAALEGFALALAADLAPNTRVNVVAPTLTPTDQGLNLVGGEKMLPVLTKRHALQKVPAPEEIAGAIAFLHSKEAASITGQVLTVDAGLTRLKTHEK
ncbi:MAG: oxidoreductase [Opitutae bacterium]|nr:oxidoreductase [Opitutae bacterium]